MKWLGPLVPLANGNRVHMSRFPARSPVVLGSHMEVSVDFCWQCVILEGLAERQEGGVRLWEWCIMVFPKLLEKLCPVGPMIKLLSLDWSQERAALAGMLAVSKDQIIQILRELWPWHSREAARRCSWKWAERFRPRNTSVPALEVRIQPGVRTWSSNPSRWVFIPGEGQSCAKIWR